jgi:hypothetical protein
MSKLNFFVAPGEADISTGKLTKRGKEQAQAASSVLHERLLGSTAVVLSIGEIRAAKTAKIIADSLDLPEKHVLHTDKIPGRDPYAIQNLDRVLGAIVIVEGLDPAEIPFVVVSPEPLVAAVRMIDPDEAAEARRIVPGEVVPYPDGAWGDNQIYGLIT